MTEEEQIAKELQDKAKNAARNREYRKTEEYLRYRAKNADRAAMRLREYRKTEKFKDWLLKNKEKHAAQSHARKDIRHKLYQDRVRKHREKYILANARSNNKSNKKFDFTIDISDIVIPEKCPVLGVDIDLGVGGHRREYGPSIDRIDNTKGYVRGNVRIISWRANRIKNDSTLNELILIGDDARKQRNAIEIREADKPCGVLCL